MSEFDKVIGYEDIKTELKKFCDVLKNPEKYEKVGVNAPAGILLYGNPGVGKTLMAQCFIKESGRKAFTIRKDKPDGDFINFIRETFEKAKAEAPCIVFLDDMDKYANEDKYHKDAEEYIAVQSQIDECKGLGVFVLATVNEKWNLPDSLLRTGRFDKVIGLRSPQGEDAIKIIAHFLKSKKVVGDVNAEEVARLIDGHTCAELESVINEAGIYAGYEGREKISQQDIVKASIRLLFDAPECMSERDPVYLEQIAIHEAGHAVLAEVLKPGSVNLVSVCKFQGSNLGVTTFRKEGELEFTKENMEIKVIRVLGGKAATEIFCGIADTGCNSDMHDAFSLVSEFVDNFCAFGFSAFESNNSSGYLLEMKDRLIAMELERYYQMAKKLLIENRVFLDAIKSELVEKKTLTCKDVALIREKCGKMAT